MGIYIKGMEMPVKKNGAVLIIFPDGKCAFEDGSEYKAVSVPPHWRLIEEEPIIKYITDGLNSGKFGYDTIEVMAEVKYAPTIIEAEGSET